MSKKDEILDVFVKLAEVGSLSEQHAHLAKELMDSMDKQDVLQKEVVTLRQERVQWLAMLKSISEIAENLAVSKAAGI